MATAMRRTPVVRNSALANGCYGIRCFMAVAEESCIRNRDESTKLMPNNAKLSVKKRKR